MPITKETAAEILKVIVDAFPLGSANIAPIVKSKSIYDDRIFINHSLFFRKKRQQQVDALIDYPLKVIAEEWFDDYRKDKIMEELDLKENQSNHQILAKYACLSEKFMTADCGYMCNFGLYYLSQKPQLCEESSVEIMSFSRTLDHSILVLNRQNGNEETIIVIDPWLNLVMTLKEFQQFWKKNFPLISSKNPDHFYKDPTYKTRGKRIIPAELDFKLEKRLDIKDFKNITVDPEIKSFSFK